MVSDLDNAITQWLHLSAPWGGRYTIGS